MATIIALIKIWKKKGKGLHLRAQFQFYEETQRKLQRILAIFLSLFNFLAQGQSIVTAEQKIVLISVQLLVFFLFAS